MSKRILSCLIAMSLWALPALAQITVTVDEP